MLLLPFSTCSVAPILYELALLVLTLARLASHARAIGWHRAPLLRLLMRDGLWAFLLAFGSRASSPWPAPPDPHSPCHVAGFVLNATLYIAVPGPYNGSAIGCVLTPFDFGGRER